MVLDCGAVGVLNILLAQGSGAVDSRRRNFEIGLSVRWFNSVTVAEKGARLNAQESKV